MTATCLTNMKPTTSRTLFHVVTSLLVLNLLVGGMHTAYSVYDRHYLLPAREAQLAAHLRAMRKGIDQYTADREHAPSSLDDLVRERYLSEVPVDPTIGGRTWDVVFETEPIVHTAQRGIADVRSSSTGLDSTGHRRYSEY